MPFTKENPTFNTGRTRFKKGITPWNKGKKTGLVPKTAFKKGHFVNENHPMWKGDDVGYVGLHLWVKRKIRREKKCLFCGSTMFINLCNISGDYKRDLNDWMYLCRKCHHKFDHISEKMWKGRRG